MIDKLSNFLIIFLIFFVLINGVYAGGGETNITYHQYDNISTYQDIMYAEEDGHFDIQFSDNYRGYCFEYGEEEATKGDKFYAEATDYTLNSNGEDVSNELKTYFVEYYNETQKNKIVTQHTIWHFTDNFDGWRLNKTLINEIKNISQQHKINDDGEKSWNDTHKMIYSFRSLISPIEQHQNFFAYKIIFQLINTTEENNNITNNTTNNTTDPIQNITSNTTNNTTDSIQNITNNTTNNTTDSIQNITNNTTNNLTENTNNTTDTNNQEIEKTENSKEQKQGNSKLISLKEYITGTDLTIPIIIIMLLGILISYKLRR